jgi:pimeloyl-ACP methyl ester carboxylesterase
MAGEIPGAQLVVLPDAAHQPQHEAPLAWRQAVCEHLERVR